MWLPIPVRSYHILLQCCLLFFHLLLLSLKCKYSKFSPPIKQSEVLPEKPYEYFPTEQTKYVPIKTQISKDTGKVSALRHVSDQSETSEIMKLANFISCWRLLRVFIEDFQSWPLSMITFTYRFRAACQTLFSFSLLPPLDQGPENTEICFRLRLKKIQNWNLSFKFIPELKDWQL